MAIDALTPEELELKNIVTESLREKGVLNNIKVFKKLNPEFQVSF